MKFLISPEHLDMAINARNRNLKIHGISEEIRLFQAFIAQQEKQIMNYIQNISSNIEQHEVRKVLSIGHDDYEEVTVQVNHIEGVSEDEYDIASLFTEDLPIYQRQSMLLTLWSLFESKLDEIYHLLLSEAKQKQKSKNKNQSNFIFLIQELTRLGCTFNTRALDEIITVFNDDIRNIRNDLAHSGGSPTRNYHNLINQSKIKITSRKIDLSNSFLIEVSDQMLVISDHIIHQLAR